MARQGSLVTIGTAAFRCLVCGNREFLGDQVGLWNAETGYPDGTLNAD